MKKRKSPIVLVTVLAVMLCVVFGLQFAWSRSGGAGQEQPQFQATDTNPVGQPRQAESKEAVSAGLKSALGGGSPSEAHAPEPGNPHAPMTGGPSILNPAAMAPSGKPEKPKPNPTSTSAQWYINK
jgi:hypothetical protein